MTTNHKNTKHIFVNKDKFDVESEMLNGTQILALAELSPDKYELFLIHGHEQQKIEPTQDVPIENGMKFQAILKDIQFGSFRS